MQLCLVLIHTIHDWGCIWKCSQFLAQCAWILQVSHCSFSTHRLVKKANVSLSCDNICTLWWWAILKHNTCDHGESWKRDTSHTAPAKLLRYLFNVCIPVKFLLPKASWENVPHKDPRINSIFWFDNYLEPVQSHMYDGFQYNQTIKQLISLCSFRA